MKFEDAELSDDRFLDRKLNILQPFKGYRAGVDPVLLAASIPAVPGQTVLELGCGAGVAVLCLGRRVGGLHLTGVEVQHGYAELARRNAERNSLALTVVEADLQHLPPPLRDLRFDHVLANPPYYLRGHGSLSGNTGRDTALFEQTPLDTWIDVASRRLNPKGYLHVIQDIARLPELLCAVQGRLGSIEVLPLAARAGRPAHLAILRARKGGRGVFQLRAPLVMHDGPTHEKDGDDYSAHIKSVLRDGSALNFPGR